MTTPKTSSPEWAASQASPDVTVNEAHRRIEAGASHYLVVDKDLTAPPGSCADGACYIVAAGGTGAWASHDGEIAIAVGTNATNGWYFRIPEEGVLAWVQDETPPLHYWDPTSSPGSWEDYATGVVGSLALDDLTDVDVPSPSDGQVLTYDTDSPQGWKAVTPATGATTLDELSDVDVPSPSDGYVLTYDTDSPAGWKALPPTGGATALNDLSDVDVPAPVDGYVLTYDSDSPSGWKALPPTGGGGAWQLTFRPTDNAPPASNYATLDSRNSHPVLDFDTTTQEAAIFTGVLPYDYAGGGVTVYAYFAATSATTGTIGWDVAFERIDASSLDIDADSFGTAHTITAATVPGTSGQILVTSVNIADGADMDSLAAGEAFRLRIRRDVTNDTAAGDAELLRVVVVEQ